MDQDLYINNKSLKTDIWVDGYDFVKSLRKRIQRNVNIFLSYLQLYQDVIYLLAELKKRGNVGNKFPEPISVLRNKVSRQGCYNQESLKLLSNNSQKMAF